MKTNIIVALCDNNGIGYKQSIPWRLKDDLKQFSKLTTGTGNNAIVMGRKAWESLPKKPLPNRVNIVLSRMYKKQDLENYDNTILCKSIMDVKKISNENNYDDLWIIGGENIYKTFLNYKIDYLYVTHIENTYECDTFFPKIPSLFLIEKQSRKYDTKNKFFYSYIKYKRIMLGDILFCKVKKNKKTVCEVKKIKKTNKDYVFTIQIGYTYYNVPLNLLSYD